MRVADLAADLAADHPISRPAVSKHLRLLVEAGLVTAEVHGRERHYALTGEGFAPVADLLAELLEPASHWPLGAYSVIRMVGSRPRIV